MKDRKKALTDMMSDDEKSGLYMDEQSPVEWLVNEIQEQLNMFFPNATLYQPTIEKAKEMEKAQLEKLKDFDTWKEWKNETFKSE